MKGLILILTPEQQINKVIRSCKNALENLHKGNKRKAVADIDFARDYLMTAVSLVINQIKDEEGEF